MKIKKLLVNYLEITKQVILKWQNEVDNARLKGNDYFLAHAANLKRWIYDGSMDNVDNRDLVKRLVQEKYVANPQKWFDAKNQQVDELKSFLLNNWELSKTQPVLIDSTRHLWHIGGDFNYQNLWLYQDAIYGMNGTYIDDEQRLLILEYCDRERRKFEQLKNKFSGKDSSSDEVKYERTRIPEQVRIAVWRRDQGRCARCGSRENLEYDHIVPVSKGGTNTERNVELLCQNHNRSKGNRIE